MACLRTTLSAMALCTSMIAVAASPLGGQVVFEPPVSYQAPAAVLGDGHITIGDVDGDSFEDILVANALLDPAVYLLRNQGDGSFGVAEQVQNVLGDALNLVDVDGDGVRDLLSAHEGNLRLSLGHGDGTFGVPTIPYDVEGVDVGQFVANAGFVLTVGDVVGSADLDLVVATNLFLQGGTLVALPGNGDGTFDAPTLVVNGSGIMQFGKPALGDINADGLVDIVVPTALPKQVLACVADGLGGWTTQPLPFSDTPDIPVELADVDGDGALDALVPALERDLVMVAMGVGDGSFAPSISLPVGARPRGLQVVDIDADGALDIVTANLHSEDLTVLRGLGDGSFAHDLTLSGLIGSSTVQATDFDHDGFVDLVATAANLPDRPLEVMLNHTYGPESPFADLGAESPGTAGFPIQLAEGALAGGDPLSLRVANGPAGGPTWLAVGLSATNAAFKGGTFVPSPDLILGPFTLDGQGGFALDAVWPEGVAPGARIYLQYWLGDPGATSGFAATSAVVATTP